jgi:hypothetical protein
MGHMGDSAVLPGLAVSIAMSSALAYAEEPGNRQTLRFVLPRNATLFSYSPDLVYLFSFLTVPELGEAHYCPDRP